MTYGVIMFYYAQHTRPITELAGIKGPSKFGSRCHLAAARAVNELRAAGSRLAQAHTKCAINTFSATLTIKSNSRDNKLKRSVNNYRDVAKCARGFVKGGYPFMFISPFDLKIQFNFK